MVPVALAKRTETQDRARCGTVHKGDDGDLEPSHQSPTTRDTRGGQLPTRVHTSAVHRGLIPHLRTLTTSGGFCYREHLLGVVTEETAPSRAHEESAAVALRL